MYQQRMIKLSGEIIDCTLKHLKHKTIEQFYAHLVEELGELARELQIEQEVYGNTYKEPGEGSKGECVDVIICLFGMITNCPVGSLTKCSRRDEASAKAVFNVFDDFRPDIKAKNLWMVFRFLCKEACDTINGNQSQVSNTIWVAFMFYRLYLKGTPEEFFKIAYEKLAKMGKIPQSQPQEISHEVQIEGLQPNR